jgi:hypothetical protein
MERREHNTDPVDRVEPLEPVPNEHRMCALQLHDVLRGIDGTPSGSQGIGDIYTKGDGFDS